MERVYEEAFYEVDEVLKLMPIDLRSKIPMQFRQAISENKAKNYKIEIKKPLNQQEFKPETVAILGLIYRDFLASPEEREKLQIEDAKEIKRIEEEKYNIDNILNKKRHKKNDGSNVREKSTELIVYGNEGFIKRIIRFFKRIFRKDKF